MIGCQFPLFSTEIKLFFNCSLSGGEWWPPPHCPPGRSSPCGLQAETPPATLRQARKTLAGPPPARAWWRGWWRDCPSPPRTWTSSGWTGRSSPPGSWPRPPPLLGSVLEHRTPWSPTQWAGSRQRWRSPPPGNISVLQCTVICKPTREQIFILYSPPMPSNMRSIFPALKFEYLSKKRVYYYRNILAHYYLQTG